MVWRLRNVLLVEKLMVRKIFSHNANEFQHLTIGIYMCYLNCKDYNFICGVGFNEIEIMHQQRRNDCN